MQWARAFIVGLVGLSLTAGCTGEKCRAHIKGGCARGWRQWGDFCYKLTEQRYLSWEEAKQECIRMGGVMAAPQSHQESAFLLTIRDEFWIDCKYNEQGMSLFPCLSLYTRTFLDNFDDGFFGQLSVNR